MDRFTAGFRTTEIVDEHDGDVIPLVLLYPSTAPERIEKLGPYQLEISMNGAVASGSFPLAVISHGTGGSHLVYRTLGRHLARNGYVVAMPEHPRNNRNNNELGGTAAILVNRPRHLQCVMDWAFSNEGLGASLIHDNVAVVGHSLGGYTALALAGGIPTAFPQETSDRQPAKLCVSADDRIKALVLLAPATAWFMAPGALASVEVPILMYSAEKDPHTTAWHADVVKQGVSDKSLIEHRIVPNAGHFAFLTPFPEAMTNPGFPPSPDPEGFDRESFHVEMNAGIVAFLNSVMLNPAVPGGGS
jgi:predicted dienelactone hydrolase